MKKDKSAFDTAVKLLGYGDKSASELWRRLTEKGFSAEDAEDAVTRLKEYRYVDDLSMARRYVEKHKAKKPKNQMLWELTNKGIDEKTAVEALKNIEDDE